MSLPYFKFYPNDWLGSQNITLMTPAEEGAYIHLLALCWNSDTCSLPDDDKTLAMVSRLGVDWVEPTVSKIKERFVLKEGRLYPKKLHGLFKDAEEVSKSKKNGADERWDKEKYFESEKEWYEKLRQDATWIAQQQKFNPNVNILLTLEKAHTQFWGSEAGWEHSKKKRTKVKNWKRTYENAISQSVNRVYNPNNSQFGTKRCAPTPEEIEQQRLFLEGK